MTHIALNPAGGREAISEDGAQQIERSVQVILDDYRAQDVAAAKARYAVYNLFDVMSA